MPGLMERLREEALLVADGAWGTELIRRGLDVLREPADAWNLSHPQLVAEIARDYARHADILVTNTFGANPVRLARFGLDGSLELINAQGASIAREATSQRRAPEKPVLVAGSMGPARGPGAAQVGGDAGKAFQRQAKSLADAGVSFILLETMTDLEEARDAVRAIKRVCQLEIVCSFAFRPINSGHFEMWSGHSVKAALSAALDAGADLVGANCIPANEGLQPLIEEMRRVAGPRPLWIKPNAGQPETRGETLHYPHPLRKAVLAPLLAALEYGVIGGCCGTTWRDVLQIRRAVDRCRDSP